MNLTLTIGSKAKIQMSPVRWLLLILGIGGLALMVIRLFTGLGVSSNLSDEWPWGLWIYLDLVFIAVAGCGFAINILTFIFKIHATSLFTSYSFSILNRFKSS